MPVTNYLWDDESDNVLMETDDMGAVTARYTNEPGQFGELISQERDGASSFYHYDGEHNTRQLTDKNEIITDTATYTAFGETIASTGATVNPFGYKGALGYYTNSETDDLYVRARTYEPTIARWLSVDPIGFIDGANRYSYVNNCPITRSDPMGLVWFEGPEAAIISFIDGFTPTAQLFWRMKDEANAAGLDTATTPLDYHRVMTMLHELAKSANPKPVAFYGAWAPFLALQEYRGFLREQVQIECNCNNNIVKYRDHGNADPGWTPLRKAFPFFNVVYHVGEHGNVTFKEAPVLGGVSKGNTCVRYIADHSFRIGMLGQIISKIVFGLGVPFAWSTIDYQICCDGSFRIGYSGSHFPTHYAYSNGAQVSSEAQRDLAAFIFRTPDKRADGRTFFVQTGNAPAHQSIVPWRTP